MARSSIDSRAPSSARPHTRSMFPHTWRQHWSLEEDPFVQEDADRDPILARVPRTAVHSSFDRLFGSPGLSLIHI